MMQVLLLLTGIYTVSCFNIYTKPTKTFQNSDDVLFGQTIVQSKAGVLSTSPNSRPQKIFSCTLDKTNCTDTDFLASPTVKGLRPIVSMANRFTEDADKLMVCQQVRNKKNLNEDFNGNCTLFFDFPNPKLQQINPIMIVVDQLKQNVSINNNNNNNNNNEDEDDDEDDGSGTEIAFVLDGSGSISKQDFEKAKLFMTTVMTNVWKKCLNCEFTVVQYGAQIRAELLLNENSDGARALKKVRNIEQIGKATVTASAILYLLNHSFVPENGSKPENKKIMIVVSDGEISNFDKKFLEPALKSLEEKNISRFAVGVGNQTQISNVTKEDMIRIAGKSENSFFVDDYNALLNILSQLETSIIQGIEGIKQGGGFQFQMAEAGFSSHMTRDGALLFGAVGANDWSGGVILKRPDQDNVVFLNDSSSSGPRFSYLGYSVVSAEGSIGTMAYISGAPRYNLVGGVFVFDVASLQQRQILQGEQVGSYFGSVLCPFDTDNDDRTDYLLVGAPFFHTSAEEGKVYVYQLHQGEFQVKFKWQGMQKYGFARFGSAIANVGDLDGNRYNDVAVGAPLEEDNKSGRSGSIYIYNGYQDGIAKDYSQRITASDFEMKLRYFGQSVSAFSNRRDSERQLYIAVGSQGVVTVLESIPTIVFSPILTLHPKTIHLNHMTSKTSLTFKLDICLRTQEKGNIAATQQLTISYRIDLDAGQNNKRIGFNNEALKEGNYTLSSDKDCFDRIQLDYLGCYDCFSPIEITLRYSLLSSSERPLRVMDRLTPREVTEKIPFEKECANNCTANISLSRSRLSHTMVIIGRTKSLAVSFSLTNHGDGAYRTTLILTYPNILLYNMVESNPGVHGPACDNEVNKEISTLKCHLLHPVFERDDKVNFTINWQLSDQKSEILDAEIFANLTCVNLNTTVLDTKKYNFGIKNALSLQLAGEAIPQLVKVTDGSENRELDFIFQLHGKNIFNATTQVNVSIEVQAQHTDVTIISVLPKNTCKVPASLKLKPSIEFLITCEGIDLEKIVIKAHASISNVQGSSETIMAKANLGYDKDLYELLEKTEFVEAKVTIVKQEVVKSMTAIIGGSIGGFLILLLLIFVLYKCGFFKRRNEVEETSHAD